MFTSMRTLWNSLPGTCQVCGGWPASAVCEACARRFGSDQLRCTGCAAPSLVGDRLCGACLTQAATAPLQACVAAVDYAYPWNDLIARFKFRNEPGWAGPFARQMMGSPKAAEVLSVADLVVPVPLTRARLAHRGYNQAWELVKALRRLLPRDKPAQPDALVRLLETPDQHTLQREQRLLNLQGVFAPHPQRIHLLQKAHVLLVDDVMTTGATLHAAAHALRQAGAAQVSALVFARTPPSHARA
ncbi:ComF family protein [Hydrogenophaga sp.]|uniref:ComF family protein n=1 Tax=Hydrogenophaga sp. TaxID=1904254 RepID=UPI002728B225|nr:phosphoribosyltransferase family protein [Hydrogenophaga sp.]MDO9436965.1 phosphoribosyltransferase family protein [Hydrogenophaga sp.]